MLLLKILQDYEINAKILKNIVYIKDGEEISKFLALIGAKKNQVVEVHIPDGIAKYKVLGISIAK